MDRGSLAVGIWKAKPVPGLHLPSYLLADAADADTYYGCLLGKESASRASAGTQLTSTTTNGSIIIHSDKFVAVLARWRRVEIGWSDGPRTCARTFFRKPEFLCRILREDRRRLLGDGEYLPFLFPQGAEGVFVIESFIGVCAYLYCYCRVVFVACSGCVCFCSRKGVLVLGTIVILFADVSVLRWELLSYCCF